MKPETKMCECGEPTQRISGLCGMCETDAGLFKEPTGHTNIPAYEQWANEQVKKYGFCHWQCELAWLKQQERINVLEAAIKDIKKD